MNPLGGHIGSDGDGLGPKQPELFDIHVMLFAGDPESTVEGLARFFSIDRDAAERLVEEVPIIVKRCAEPDVAAEMVDVLGGLGAQVVLLPAATAISPETDLLELKVPSIPPAAAEPARRADTVDLIAAAPVAELDLAPRAPVRSAPPARRGVIDDELVIAPLYDPSEPPVAPPAPPVPDLGLGSVPPLPQLGAIPPAPPPVPNATLRGAPRVPPPSPKPPRPPARPQPPPAPGVVPGAAQQRSLYERTLETGGAAKLPSLGVVSMATDAKAARSAGGDSYWSGRRAAGVAAAELGSGDAQAAPRAAATDAEPSGGAPGEALRGVPTRPIGRATSEVKAVRTRSAGRAVLQLVGGALIFGICLQQGNSILLGNADAVSLALHALALFTFGLGLAELRP